MEQFIGNNQDDDISREILELITRTNFTSDIDFSNAVRISLQIWSKYLDHLPTPEEIRISKLWFSWFSIQMQNLTVSLPHSPILLVDLCLHFKDSLEIPSQILQLAIHQISH
jgi:hypothetical protein